MPKRENRIVKLQRRFAYRYKNREHFKHLLTVPDNILEELGWKEGQQITLKVRGLKLVCEVINSEEPEPEELWSHNENESDTDSDTVSDTDEGKEHDRHPLKGILLWCHKWLDNNEAGEKADEWS